MNINQSNLMNIVSPSLINSILHPIWKPIPEPLKQIFCSVAVLVSTQFTLLLPKNFTRPTTQSQSSKTLSPVPCAGPLALVISKGSARSS